MPCVAEALPTLQALAHPPDRSARRFWCRCFVLPGSRLLQVNKTRTLIGDQTGHAYLSSFRIPLFRMYKQKLGIWEQNFKTVEIDLESSITQH